MPFTFQVPTTTALSYPDFLRSATHSSLPLAASTHREVLRSVLKKHKRLSNQSQALNLHNVLSAFETYIPFLFAIDAGISNKTVNDEEVEITLLKEVEFEWRAPLASTNLGFEATRVKGKGLDYEICIVLTSLGCVASSLAQSQLRALHVSITPTIEERTSIILATTKLLLKANSIHAYLVSRVDEIASPPIIETTASAQEALSALALAEATLLAVLKDDPYPAVVAQSRNENDHDWKFKAPEIPKVRAHLGARLCLAAAEHAEKAEAMLNALGGGRASNVDDALIKYIVNLRKTSRAKACRLFGVGAESEGGTGLGIAWLMAGKKELGFTAAAEQGSRLRSLAKFKRDWTERMEVKKIEKGDAWGSDAGRLEECRVLNMLEKKWNKSNDTVRFVSRNSSSFSEQVQINSQIIPPWESLLATAPSGRNIHSSKLFVPPCLDVDVLERMRAPPDEDDTDLACDDESTEENDIRDNPPGIFAGGASTKSGEASYY